MRVMTRPWVGFGFGRAILADQLKGEMQNPVLWHAHNLFVSQWLQTGAVGLALFAALLVALGTRFARFVRSRDETLAFVGIIGISLIAGFVVKNLTDDFLFRSNAKEFWALLALLQGFGSRLETMPRATRATATRPRSGSREGRRHQRRRCANIVTEAAGVAGSSGPRYAYLGDPRLEPRPHFDVARGAVTFEPCDHLIDGFAAACVRLGDAQFRMRCGQGRFARCEGFLVEFFARTQASEDDADPVRIPTGQPNHVACKVDDLYRLAHVQHEHLASPAHEARL